MANNKHKNSLWTSANIVTMIRIILVPVFVVALISPWPRWLNLDANFDVIKPWIALLIFVILSITDSLDGYLARKKNEITNFGKFMDPLADKILVFAALVSLVELSVLPSWVVLIMLMREFIVSGLRMLAASKGKVIAASWYGKAKTVTQLIAIILFIVKESLSASGAQNIADPLYIVAWTVMIVALILTIVSMIDYIYNARFVFADENDETLNVAKDVVKLAKEKDISISCAESLTGGMISSAITSVGGASSVFLGGIVSYAYIIKEKILSVDSKNLKENGAVNEKCALDMVVGCKKLLDSDIAISATGIAGPDKDEFNTDIGCVYIGFTSANKTEAFKLNLEGNREEIRAKVVFEALNIIKKYLNSI